MRSDYEANHPVVVESLLGLFSSDPRIRVVWMNGIRDYVNARIAPAHFMLRAIGFALERC
jgi:hypothetical protein